MRQRIKFTDERVCKSHLLDSCPHDILSGTVSILFIHTLTLTAMHREHHISYTLQSESISIVVSLNAHIHIV